MTLETKLAIFEERLRILGAIEDAMEAVVDGADGMEALKDMHDAAQEKMTVSSQQIGNTACMAQAARMFLSRMAA